jgi:hypothetical protein
MKMRRSLIGFIVAACPVAALAQAQPQPKILTGTTAQVARAAMASTPPAPPDGGGPASALFIARQTLVAIETVCSLDEQDRTLVADCDSSLPEARGTGPSHLPQAKTEEWEFFGRRLAAADATVNGKPRRVLILNGGKLVVQVTAGGVATLTK